VKIWGRCPINNHFIHYFRSYFPYSILFSYLFRFRPSLAFSFILNFFRFPYPRFALFLNHKLVFRFLLHLFILTRHMSFTFPLSSSLLYLPSSSYCHLPYICFLFSFFSCIISSYILTSCVPGPCYGWWPVRYFIVLSRPKGSSWGSWPNIHSCKYGVRKEDTPILLQMWGRESEI
jgi:hypothetical protein